MARTKQTPKKRPQYDRPSKKLGKGKRTKLKVKRHTSPQLTEAIKKRAAEIAKGKQVAKERQARIEAERRARNGVSPASKKSKKSGKDPMPGEVGRLLSPKKRKTLPEVDLTGVRPKKKKTTKKKKSWYEQFRVKGPVLDKDIEPKPKGIGKSPRKKFLRRRMEEVDLTGVRPKPKPKPKPKPRKNDPNPDGLTLDATGKPTNCGPNKTGVRACEINYVRKPQCRWRPGRQPAVV